MQKNLKEKIVMVFVVLLIVVSPIFQIPLSFFGKRGLKGVKKALYKTSSKSQFPGSAEGEALCWSFRGRMGVSPNFPFSPPNWERKGVDKFDCH
jgi:hypothetical protein